MSPPLGRPGAALALAALTAVAAAGCGGAERRTDGGELSVFAAASLREAVSEISDAFTRREGVEIVLNLAASNTLAGQILAAPGADVFLSADLAWIEAVERAGRAVPGSRRVILSNRLVAVARPDAAAGPGHPAELAGDGYRHLALADPAAVPAGRYARAALEHLAADGGNLWQAVAERVVPTLDVRAALALAASDPEIVAIVYRTDASTSERVRVLFELPEAGVPVAYGAVLIEGGGSPEAGRRFLAFLASPAARAIAARHGFLPPPGETP